MTAGAEFSADRRYRYRLWRGWDDTRKSLCWIMLNPSTADEQEDDATIRVCIGRAQRLGYGWIDVVNLFALRSAHPDTLYDDPAPISHPNEPFRCDRALISATGIAGMVICAWGKHGTYQSRAVHILANLKNRNIPAYVLKFNRDDSPAHPLRISYDKQPEPLFIIAPEIIRCMI